MIRFNVGDRVEISSGGIGTVVGVIDRHEFARNLESWRWASLTEGLLVLLDDGAFAHVQKSELASLRAATEESR